MKSQIKIVAGIIILAGVFAGACQMSIPGEVDQNLVATESQKLIESGRATQTALAFKTMAAKLTQGVDQPTEIATAGPSPTDTPPPSSATPPKPTVTPLPSFTPIPSFTPKPTITPIPCDRADFVADVTIPDGTVMSPGATFTKTWRLKNSGICTWSTNYALIFASGDQMGATSQIPLPSEVTPGSTVDLSVTFTAPTSEGEYRSNWKLKNASGVQFGTGSKAGGSVFYADIQVKSAASKYALDFAALYCMAEWTSGAGTLVCPGSSGDSKGYVQRIDNPTLENGAVENEPVLLTVPQVQTDGSIRGKYPVFQVQSGNHFKAILGCVKEAKNCSVKFELDYVVDGESTIQSAGSWVKTWDGSNLVNVDLDLSSLAGKKVRFILAVFANGEMNDDRAQWLAPRITKP